MTVPNLLRRVPWLGFGCLRLQREDGADEYWPSEPTARKVIRAAFDNGVRLFDTAPAYGNGANERLVASALAPVRDQVLIATKCGIFRGEGGEWCLDGRPESLRAQCLESLRSLGTEVIDLLTLHAPDPRIPLAEQAGCLGDLQDDGLVRAIGLSNVRIETLAPDGVDLNRFSVVQNHWSALHPPSAREIGLIAAAGSILMAWFPLEAGLICSSRSRRMLDLAAQSGLTPAQLALTALRSYSTSMYAIPGTSSLKHVQENSAVIDFSPSETTAAAIADACEVYRRLGSLRRRANQGQADERS